MDDAKRAAMEAYEASRGEKDKKWNQLTLDAQRELTAAQESPAPEPAPEPEPEPEPEEVEDDEPAEGELF